MLSWKNLISLIWIITFMCILFIAVEQHPDYPVIICANRDEFHQRPTQSMHWWSEQNILAGKDLQAGGTWLGLSPDGNFSALTNFRKPDSFDAKKRSRGDLVVQALHNSPACTQQKLLQASSQYNDFTLVFGPLNNLQAFDSISKKFVALTPGFHSVCNGALDDIWPKMALGVNNITDLITNNNINIEEFFAVMSNQTIADKQDLPATGISAEWELLLSSIFIKSADYGTRSTVIILQTKSGAVDIYEQSYNCEGELQSNNDFHLNMLEAK